MPTRIRLQRRGKKGFPFYHIVIADGRAPRDGKFIETIGTYNPLTKPATIELNNEKALQWLKNGASPTDTVLALLKYKGVMYKYHLLKGVKKGALTEEQAEEKYVNWLKEKETKIKSKINQHAVEEKQLEKKQLEAEIKINQKKYEALAAKKAKEAAKHAETSMPDAEEQQPEPIAETQLSTEAVEQSTVALADQTPDTALDNEITKSEIQPSEVDNQEKQ